MNKGTHASKRDNFSIFFVILNRRTRRTRSEGNDAGRKIYSALTVCALAHRRYQEDFKMGLFSKKKKEGAPLDELTPETKSKLDELAQRGNALEKEGRLEEAVQVWQEGLSLIPEPQQFYGETVWFLAAVGDVYFQKRMYREAHDCFDKARGNLSGEGYGNPFVMLRLGECCLEIGDEKNALEYLLRAYMFAGEEIFEPDEDGEDDGQKYFDFLSAHVDLNRG